MRRSLLERLCFIHGSIKTHGTLLPTNYPVVEEDLGTGLEYQLCVDDKKNDYAAKMTTALQKMGLVSG